MADRCFEPGPAFFAVASWLWGEGALIFCLIRGMRPDTIFPLTSTKLPLYLAGGDDGDSDEGDRQRGTGRGRGCRQLLRRAAKLPWAD